MARVLHGSGLALEAGMKSPVNFLVLFLSLLVAVPGIPRDAAASEMKTAGPSSDTSTMPMIVFDTTHPDPIGKWLEENAEQFGLLEPVMFTDRPKSNNSMVYRPNGAKTTPHSVVFRYVGDGTANPKNIIPDIPKIIKKVFTPPPEALKSEDAAVQISAVMKDLNYAATCSMFASSKGLGSWGQYIVDELVRGKGNSLIEGSNDLREACPNYDHLGVREKSHVWVKIFAAMAHRESSCNPKASRPGEHGQAVGLFQLHQGAEQRYSKGCKANDSGSVSGSLRCGIAMIDGQMQQKNQLFHPKTHFGVLRPQGDLVPDKNGRKQRVFLARLVIGGLKELPFCQRN